MPSLLRQYWSLLDRSAQLQAKGLVVLALATSFAEGVGVGLIFPLIKIVLEPEFITTNPVLRSAYDTFGFNSTRAFTFTAIAVMFAVIMAKNGLSYFNVLAQYRFVFRNEARTSSRLLSVYLHTPYMAIMGRPSADLLTSANNRVYVTFRDGVLAVISILTEGFAALAIAAILIFANPQVGFLTAALLAVGIGGFYAFFRGRYTKLGARDQELNKENLISIQQCFGVAREVRILGRQGYFLDRFSEVRRQMQEVQLKHSVWSQLPRMAIETVTMAAMLAVLAFVLLRGENVAEFMATFGLFAAAAFRLMPSASKFLHLLGQIRRSQPFTKMVISDLEQWEKAAAAARADRGDAALPLTRNLAIENVSFTYPETQTPVIDRLSLDLKRGESVALVGPSGGGKSTLVDMLLGLLPPSDGRITVDGVDIAGNLAGWRREIGYVPQMPFLIDDTLTRNIALGVPDDRIDDAAITRAVRLAQLESFVAQLPEGLETRIGELGTRISGGQRQRVAIARALYSNPSVLILDEATSSLDNETEAEFTRAVEDLAGQLTIIIIAHRLSTVRHCNRVALMSEGRVVDIGRFDELTERNPQMRNLVRLGELAPTA